MKYIVFASISVYALILVLLRIELHWIHFYRPKIVYLTPLNVLFHIYKYVTSFKMICTYYFETRGWYVKIDVYQILKPYLLSSVKLV